MAAQTHSKLMSELFAKMEASAELVRIKKAMKKAPQARSEADVQRIMKKTEEVPLLIHDGPAVHKDLCHVLKCKRFGESETMKIQFDQKTAPAFYLVLSGTVRIMTLDRSSLENVVECRENGNKSDKASSTTVFTEDEILSLFDEIDADGSGAIDCEELQLALEMMGIKLSMGKVSELIDSVDDDGSGELEFPEFKQIFMEKLSLGADSSIPTEWVENERGEFYRDYPAGTWFGEKFILEDDIQISLRVLFVDTTALAVLEKKDYLFIKENGFDGNLNKKVEILQGLAIIKVTIKHTGLRSIAYLTRIEDRPTKSLLCCEGEPATALHIVLEGECKVVKKTASPVVTVSLPPEFNNPIAGLMGGRKSLMRANCGKKASVHTHTMEVAVLTQGDLFGEGALMEEECHKNSVVASTPVTILSVDRRDLEKTLHTRDMEAVLRHVRKTSAWRQEHIHRAKETMMTASVQAKQTYYDIHGPGAMVKSLSEVDELQKRHRASSLIASTRGGALGTQGWKRSTKTVLNSIDFKAEQFPTEATSCNDADARRLSLANITSPQHDEFSEPSLSERPSLRPYRSLPPPPWSDRTHYNPARLPSLFAGSSFHSELKHRQSILAHMMPKVFGEAFEEPAHWLPSDSEGDQMMHLHSEELERVVSVDKVSNVYRHTSLPTQANPNTSDIGDRQHNIGSMENAPLSRYSSSVSFWSGFQGGLFDGDDASLVEKGRTTVSAVNRDPKVRVPPIEGLHRAQVAKPARECMPTRKTPRKSRCTAFYSPRIPATGRNKRVGELRGASTENKNDTEQKFQGPERDSPPHATRECEHEIAEYSPPSTAQEGFITDSFPSPLFSTAARSDSLTRRIKLIEALVKEGNSTSWNQLKDEHS
ncbi:hypothetical protein BSKO_07512 [Bryopsis sp. KO-2023]|nr:hypothetical protein BSKO_07512 [Bryopsis sp. KO-2023]